MNRFWSDEGVEPELFDEVAKYNLRLYDGELASIDSTLGRVFEQLRALGVWDETLVAVTSDHGEEFGEHGLMGHANQLHEESLHVPLIVRGPGVAAGARETRRVENRFLAPTLLELVGVEPRDNIRGPNLLEPADVFEHSSEPFYFGVNNAHVYDTANERWWASPGVVGFRDDRWAFFWSPRRGDQPEVTNLYSLEDDPHAQRDLAPERPDLVKRFKAQIHAWRKAGESEASVENPMEGADDLEEMRALGYVGDE